MKLISTKISSSYKILDKFSQKKKKAFTALLFLTQFIAGNITVNVFHISNLDFINISLKGEPISKSYLPVLDTE
jgi:hypothetical protein